MKKFVSIIMAAAISCSAAAAMSADVSAYWVKYSDGAYGYRDNDTKEKLTGWQEIDGGKYYFTEKGKAVTGWKTIDGSKYFFQASKRGRALTGWVKINGNTYYFGDDGVMRTGKVRLKNILYTFDDNGVYLKAENARTDAKITDAAKGLKFGMTREQVIENMPYKDYAPDGDDAITANAGRDDFESFYLFDTNDRLCSYGWISTADYVTLDDGKALFENAGWEQMEDDGDTVIYLSPDGKYSAVAADTDGVIMSFVYSEEIFDYLGT